jgi:hypothetical protein
MEQDDFRILQEQERDRLMELHCRQNTPPSTSSKA